MHHRSFCRRSRAGLGSWGHVCRAACPRRTARQQHRQSNRGPATNPETRPQQAIAAAAKVPACLSLPAARRLHRTEIAVLRLCRSTPPPNLLTLPVLTQALIWANCGFQSFAPTRFARKLSMVRLTGWGPQSAGGLESGCRPASTQRSSRRRGG